MLIRNCILLCIIVFALFSGTLLCFGSGDPLQLENGGTLTRHAEMMNWLAHVQQSDSSITLETMGKSAGGKDIAAVFFSPKEDYTALSGKLRVLIFCQQHGDEPSGKEAALHVIKDLLGKHKELRDKLSIIICPMVNPDGADSDNRRNANGVDLNRDHVDLSQPETVVMHRLFLKYMPEVTLDVHEYNGLSPWWISHGFRKNADQMLGGLTNLNIAASIREFSRETCIPTVGSKVEQAGFTFHEYVVGSPFEDERIRFSTVAIDDGRQSFGVYQTMSFIMEGLKYGDVTNKLKKRIEAQKTAMFAFLETMAENSTQIQRIVSSERQYGKWKSGARVALQMEHYPESTKPTLEFPVFSIETWRDEIRPLDHFHPRTSIRLSRTVPWAYIIPGTEVTLLEAIDRHAIRTHVLTDSLTVQVEVHTIHHITTRLEEELTLPHLEGDWSLEERTFTPGDVMVILEQSAFLKIPLLLESQSSYGFIVQEDGLTQYFQKPLREGSEFPVYRLMKKPKSLKLPLTPEE